MRPINSLIWRIVVVIIGLFALVVSVGAILQRRAKYPVAAELILPMIALLGFVTILSIVGQLRWKIHRLYFLGAQVCFYVGYMAYCWGLPASATPGQLIIPITPFILITTAVASPTFLGNKDESA